MTQEKPIALWAVPGSISPVFERVFVERDDLEVLHEPFSESYYYNGERLNGRCSDVDSKAQYNYYDNVLARILEPRENRVFVKDMAYHVEALIGPEFINHFTNTFIIRDPKYVISSLYRMWPDFALEATGFEQLYRLFKYATEADPEGVVVIDAMTFSENPVGILTAYCEHLNIPFWPDSLLWEPIDVLEWERWYRWHDKTHQSIAPDGAERKDPTLQEAYEYCLPYYYQLAAKAIPSVVRGLPSVYQGSTQSR
jgi:hypothetical protein